MEYGEELKRKILEDLIWVNGECPACSIDFRNRIIAARVGVQIAHRNEVNKILNSCEDSLLHEYGFKWEINKL